MNEVSLIALLLAVISVLVVFTLVQYNELNPHSFNEHHFARSGEVFLRNNLSVGPAPTLVNAHANTTNQTVFLLSRN
jgi:hypothetical protein